MPDIDLDELRRSLAQRLHGLRESSEGSAESRKPVELDQTTVGRLSRMDAMQVQAMAQAEERRRNQEAARIMATLKRIDEGDYGYCVVCGDEIAPKRLAADPTHANCIRCASAREE